MITKQYDNKKDQGKPSNFMGTIMILICLSEENRLIEKKNSKIGTQ